MKKAIVILLVLSIVFPIVSLADTEEELIGAWIGMRESYPGDITYFFVRLYEDHSALYESSKFTKFDSESTSFVNPGTWELKEDGVHVYYKNFWNPKQTDDFLLELTNAHYLAHKLVTEYILFVKLPDCRPIEKTRIVENWD